MLMVLLLIYLKKLIINKKKHVEWHFPTTGNVVTLPLAYALG